jgi:hypothetical protein
MRELLDEGRMERQHKERPRLQDDGRVRVHREEHDEPAPVHIVRHALIPAGQDERRDAAGPREKHQSNQPLRWSSARRSSKSESPGFGPRNSVTIARPTGSRALRAAFGGTRSGAPTCAALAVEHAA